MINRDYDLNLLRDLGADTLCGIDEAGRGPLLGPVVAAACVLPHGFVPEGLDDSKKLTPKRRDALFDVITASAVSYGIGLASAAEIDEYNILEATLLAMRRALAQLSVRPDYLLVDGNVFRGFDIPGSCLISGDAISPSVAAASIIAKVTRDRICLELDKKYPGYGIAAHKGYGTAAHMAALRELGPCPEHRRKFIRFLDRENCDGKSD